MIRELFQPHNQFLKETFFFEINDLLEFLIYIAKTTPYIGFFAYRDSKNIQLSVKNDIDVKIIKFTNECSKNPFIIEAKEEWQQKFLNLISLKFSENYTYLNLKNWSGWPTNYNILYNKPVIKFKGDFYCFFPNMLIENIFYILTEIIRNSNEKYYSKTFLNKRKEYLEEKPLEYFAKLLLGSRIYKNLFYHLIKNVKKKRFEIDSLIIFDNNILIIEAKSGNFTIRARRGYTDRIKKTAQELIDGAYNQAMNTKKYILESQNPKFFYKNGNLALELKNKSDFDNFYLINTTLEKLGPLSSKLNLVSNFNLIKGKEWPWSIYINELRIISDLIESPSEFLLYLKRRIEINEYNQFHSMDEIDYLEFFFHAGMKINPKILDKFKIIPLDSSFQINKYYNYLAGRAEKYKKPQFKINNGIKEFIKKIELCGKFKFTKITTHILGLEKVEHDLINSKLEKLVDRTRIDDIDHSFYYNGIDSNTGLVIITNKHYFEKERIKYINYAKIKKYQNKKDILFLILLEVNDDTYKINDLYIFDKKWKYNPIKQKNIRTLVNTGQFEKINSKLKIGRNEPCPCGSGKKFKKCCGRL